MSCKILPPGAGTGEAIEWRSVPPPSPAPRAQNLYAPPAPAPGAASVPRGQLEALEQRIAVLQQEAEQRAAESYRRGVSEGEAAAARRAEEQMKSKVEQLGRAIEHLAGFRARIRRETEPEMVRLSVAIARRILRRELTVDPHALTGLLKAALEKIDAAEVHRVRIHPQYTAVVRNLLAGAASRIEISGDETVDPGTVVMETARGAIDASVETQLSEIERGFADLYPV
jgi:flagellar assembly protein FliH